MRTLARIAPLLLLAACAAPVDDTSVRTDDVQQGGPLVFDYDDGTSAVVGGDAFAQTAEVVRAARTERILATLVEFAGRPSDCTTSEIDVAMFSEVATHLASITRSRVTMRGDTEPPIVVARNQDCRFGDWARDADAELTKRGVDLSAYDRRVYFVSSASCGVRGIAELGGQRAWIVGPSCRNAHVILHELGHNFGLLHASTPAGEYGDRSDPQGAAVGPMPGYNAIHAMRMGVLDPNELREVRTANSIVLPALAARRDHRPLDNTRVLRVDHPNEPSALLVSYRARVGFDVDVPSAYGDRVQVHRAEDQPRTSSVLVGSLRAGDVFHDDASGLALTVNSIGSTANIDIVFACRRSLVRIMPLTNVTTIRPGGRRTLVLRIDNTDTLGCAPRAAEVSATATVQGVLATSSRTMVDPGSSATVELEVAADDNAVDAYGDLRIRVVSAGVDETRLDSPIAVDGTPPTVPANLTATRDGPRSNVVRLSWTPSDEASGSAAYDVSRNGVVIGHVDFTRSGQPIAFKDTNLMRGVLRYRVRAIDEAGNVSQDSNEAVVVVRSLGF